MNILVIGKDPEILKVVLRLLNEYKPTSYHAGGSTRTSYHAFGSTDPDQARSLIADHARI